MSGFHRVACATLRHGTDVRCVSEHGCERDFGGDNLRHSAIGLTEESDAVSVVVSEETGAVSVSVFGKLTRDLDAEELRRVLTSLFRSAEGTAGWNRFWQGDWRKVRLPWGEGFGKR